MKLAWKVDDQEAKNAVIRIKRLRDSYELLQVKTERLKEKLECQLTD